MILSHGFKPRLRSCTRTRSASHPSAPVRVLGSTVPPSFLFSPGIFTVALVVVLDGVSESTQSSRELLLLDFDQY